MTIGDRIRTLRVEQGLSQQELSDKIKVGRSTLAQFEKGTRVVKDIHIEQICREFNVNEDWLRDGTGEMFKEIQYNPVDELMGDDPIYSTLDEVDKKILQTYMELPEDIRKALKSKIVELAQLISKED